MQWVVDKDTRSVTVGRARTKKKGRVRRGLWELFQHVRCRGKLYLGGAVGAAGFGAGFAGVFVAGAPDAGGAATPDDVL